jgi:hypothetical protein
MARKLYTKKGLASTVSAAQERHVRLESKRIARSVGVDPLEAAAALTAASPEFAAAELVVGCELMLEDAALDEAEGGRR